MLRSVLIASSAIVFAGAMTLAGAGAVFAADAATVEPMPVSGSFDYTPHVFSQIAAGGGAFVDASEDEVWSGDIKGTSVAPFRVVVSPDGSVAAWVNSEFKGTVLGKYEGTMNIVTLYTKPAQKAHWTGEWIILSGTGGLKNVQGHGAAWGPGAGGAGPGVPAINYSGEVVFPAE